MGIERRPVGVCAPNTAASLAFADLWVRIQSTAKAKQRMSRNSSVSGTFAARRRAA